MSCNTKMLHIIVICLLLFTSSVFSANPGLEYGRFLQRLSTEEGLSQSYVTKIVKDHQGYLWVGTQMGLNRYDGYTITSFPGPDNVFEQDLISTLFIDSDGYIWVGTSYSGLFRVSPKTYNAELIVPAKINKTDDYYSEAIAIVQQSHDILWIGISQGLFKLNRRSGELQQVFKLSTSDDIFRALTIHKGSLYAGSSDGLYHVNLTTNEVQLIEHKPANITVENSNNVKLLKYINKRGLYVGTVEGLFLLPENLNQTLAKPIPLQLNLNIWDFVKNQEQYYLGTDRGLFQYDLATNQTTLLLTYKNSRYQASDNNILDIYSDESGSLWLASQSHGLFHWQISTTKFSHITPSQPYNLSNENVWAIFNDQEHLWIGTDNGLNKVNLNNKSNQPYLASKELRNASNDSYINAIYKNNEDNNLLWLVTGSGLFQFDKTTNQVSPPPYSDKARPIMENNWLGGAYVANNEQMYFFNTHAHYLYNPTSGEINKITALDDLDPDLSYSFLGYLPNSQKMLLTTSGHLYLYDADTQTKQLIYRVKNYQPQSFSYVDSWLIDEHNTLWLAVSGEGLIGLDKNSYQEKFRFDISNGLKSNYIYNLHLDKNNGLWFGSQQGLYKLNLESQHIEQYNASDGLLSAEFNGFAYSKLGNDQIAYGTPLGVTIFSPKEISTDQTTSDYKVHLTNLELMSSNKKLTADGNNAITLNYDDYGLNVYFSTLEFANINRTIYQVKLSGDNLNLNWPNYQKNHLLLPKIIPGKYSLEIQAIHPITGERSEPQKLLINVQYAPWATPLAKLVYFLILTFALILFIYSRNKRNLELQQANLEAEFSHNRMEMALNSSKSGVWEYRKLDDYIFYDNLYLELGYQNEQAHSQGTKYFELINPIHRIHLKPKWQNFLNGKLDDWEEIYQLRAQNGEWLWFKFVGKAIAWDRFNSPIKFSGTYTNINQAKLAEEEALIFGSAFSQINDWVLILNSQLTPVTANEAFRKVLSISDINAQTLTVLSQKLGVKKFKKYRDILLKLETKGSWQGEEYLETNSSRAHPVLIKINAITAQQNNISHYVVVISDITVQKEAEEKLRHIAHYDFLTDLPNRKLLFERICEKVKNRDKFALLFIDLDKFKQVNDLYNHTVGDILLQNVADKLVSLVSHHDLVARQSGDEFIILVEKYQSIDYLSHLAQSIIDQLKQTIIIDKLNINISSSIGLSLFPDDSITADALIQKADVAMIHAKNSGRNQFQFFTEDMNTKAHDRLKLEELLKTATVANQLTNFYQPIINSKLNNKIVGCELLLRWFHGDKLISPGEFIPIAEETGLIKEITVNAIEQALIDYNRHFKTLNEFYISINLSPVHIAQDGLVESLIMLLEKHQLPASVLRFEITEGAVLDDMEVALQKLNKLRQHGFVLLLDDFGTGYSSMTYLSRFPVQYLKIDKSFILNLDQKVNKSIVQSILFLAEKMELTCIAEGVEESKHLQMLYQLGCPLIQGFYYSKPLPINEFIQLNFNQNK